MAFDKCTLLSSQGSDAPTFKSLDHLRKATSLAYPAPRPCQIDTPSRPTKVNPHEPANDCTRKWIPHCKPTGSQHQTTTEAATLMGVVHHVRGVKLSASSASLWGEQVRTYAESQPTPKSSTPPGRVASIDRAVNPWSSQETQCAGGGARSGAFEAAPALQSALYGRKLATTDSMRMHPGRVPGLCVSAHATSLTT